MLNPFQGLRMKIFVIGGVSAAQASAEVFEESIIASTMRQLGYDVISRGHDLLVCSPFPASADFDAFQGAVAASRFTERSIVEIHCPDEPSVQRELEKLATAITPARLHRHFYPVSRNESGKVNWTHTWLLAQVSAMDRADAIVALGGQPAKSASLLLALAESRRKRILPLTFADGAAAALFQRRRYELQDRLADRIAALHEPTRVGQAVELVEMLVADMPAGAIAPTRPRIFISYPRSRPEEADFVEMTLRRRNYDVYRDERDFGAGEHVHREIVEHIYRSTVFLVIWCKEYACSPWCYDELEIALEAAQNFRLGAMDSVRR
jgi:hypothetical protein